MSSHEPRERGAPTNAEGPGAGLLDLLKGSLRLAHELVRPETSICLVLDDEAENLVCLAAEGRNADRLSDYRLRLGEGVAGLAAVEGCPVASRDTDTEARLEQQTAEATGLPVKDVLCAALRAGEDVFGVIELLNSTRPGGFTERDADLLRIIAGQAAAAMEVASRLERARHGFVSTVEYLASVIDAREGSVHCHPKDALPLAKAVCERLRLSDEDRAAVELTMILHDVGRASVGQELPHEPRELTEGERAVVRGHPLVGALLLQPLADAGMIGVVAGVKHHHEWMDGRGYPDGLQGEQIPIAGRVAAVVQAYLAMTEGRPYRPPMTTKEAVEELRNSAGSQFDPKIVEALVWYQSEIAASSSST